MKYNQFDLFQWQTGFQENQGRACLYQDKRIKN